MEKVYRCDPYVMSEILWCIFIFFFNDTATTEIYTLSLHDALPIRVARVAAARPPMTARPRGAVCSPRSEEHTSELQSRPHLVCRLLLEKKNNHPRVNAPMRIKREILDPQMRRRLFISKVVELNRAL